MALMKRAASMPPRLSPERTALALALDAALKAKQARDAALADEDRPTRAVKAATDALEVARHSLQRTKAKAAEDASRASHGDVMELPPAIREARASLTEAEDRLELALTVRDRANGRRATLDADMAKARANVEAARDAVIVAEGSARVKALKSELIAAQRRMVAVASELRWLMDAGAVPLVTEPGPSFGRPADRELHVALFRSIEGNIPLETDRLASLLPSPSPAQVWAEAATALTQDATASLPGASK